MSINAPIETPYGNWESGWKDTWDEAHDLISANYSAGASPNATQTYSGGLFLIKRGVFTVDLSDVPPGTNIERAKLYLEYASGKNETASAIQAVIVDGTGVPLNDGGYDDMMLKTTWYGSLAIPAYANYLGQVRNIPFNAVGRAALEAAIGGTLQLGLRMSEDISDTQPDPGQQYFNWNTSYDMYVRINWLPGYVWVEGTKIAYIDNNGNKRTKEGTTTGTTGKIAGHHSVEGDYLHYIDSSGAERRILGSTTGLTGKQPSQISINTKSPMLGMHLCYIDSSGNERSFEGTAS